MNPTPFHAVVPSAARRPQSARIARLAVVALAVAVLAGCAGKEGRIESGLKKGAEFVRVGDLDKARVEIRNVLQIDPKNAQAHLLSARIAEVQQEFPVAYGAYLKAVELDPTLLPAKVGLARLYLFSGDLVNARKEIDQVLAVESGHLEARSLQAALMLAAGKRDEALATVEALVREAGADAPADATLLLAGLYASRNQDARALEVVEEALGRRPKDIALLEVATRISAALAAKDPAMAERAAGYHRRGVAEAPKNDNLWLAWANFHVTRNEIDRAEAVLRDAIKASPDSSRRAQNLLDFMASRRGLDAAEQEYLKFIKDRPRDMTLRFGLANLYRIDRRPAEAQRVLHEIVASDDVPNQIAAKNQLSIYKLSEGKFAEARALADEVLRANPRDSQALVLRGRLHLVDGQPVDAVNDLRAAARELPGSADVIQLLALAHHGAKEPQLARAVVADALKAKPEDPALALLLAGDMADARDFKGAIAELDAAIARSPKAARLYEAKAQMQMAQKNPAGAEKTLQALKAQTPRQAIGYLRLGQLHAEQGRFDAALREYDAGSAAAPRDVALYAASVALLVSQKRFEDALARIGARQKTDERNVLHRQLRGDVAMARGDWAAAEVAYREAIEVTPELHVGYTNTARALMARNDLPGALRVLEEGEKRAPTESAIPLARAEWLARAARYPEAIALYEDLHQRFPDNDSVANNLAYLLSETRDDRPSLERGRTLAQRFVESRDPNLLDSLGWTHYRLGEYEKAVAVFERANRLAPPTPLLQLHLGKALVKQGEVARGQALIRQAIDSKANLPRLDEARSLLARG